jgi:hypothetical protein
MIVDIETMVVEQETDMGTMITEMDMGVNENGGYETCAMDVYMKDR